MAIDLTQFQNLGLPEIVLWMLSFAIIYGILDQAKTPGSKASRGIISIVIAFFVLLSAPATLTVFLSNMTSSLVLVLVGLLVLIIFLEVAGIKAEPAFYDEEGKRIKFPLGKEPDSVPIFQRYGYIFAIAFIIIAALIFVNAGGLQTLGININLSGAATTTTAFFIFIILAVIWMVAEKK